MKIIDSVAEATYASQLASEAAFFPPARAAIDYWLLR